MINTDILKQIQLFAGQFQHGTPYKHVCIENFFDASVAEQILNDFPSFDFTPKKNEFGNDGPKAVYENLSEISPFYHQLTSYLRSDEFNNLISHLTGIEGLRWGGESMYGGGTHENINGAELDPHVDFNYDDRTKEHRRINLLVYLNKEWELDWGGEFELHSNPRNSDNNEIKSYLPLFNRAVIMETSEKSWHGFPLIKLPNEKKHLSRKSIALYFYTKERPQEEVQGAHATFYIHRPLPDSFRPGELISQKLYDEIKYLVFKRDSFIELYQQGEINASKQFDSLKENYEQMVSRLRVSVFGWAKQIGEVKGYYYDDWMSKNFSANFIAQRSINSVRVRFYIPEHAQLPMLLTFTANGVKEDKNINTYGMEEMSIHIELSEGSEINVELNSSTSISGNNGDNRELSVVLNAFIFE